MVEKTVRDLARLERLDQLGHPRAQRLAFRPRHESRQHQIAVALEPLSMAGRGHDRRLRPFDIIMTPNEHHGMVRTQVYFSEEQHRALRRAAKREGISTAALLRRMVERELQFEETKRDAIMAFVGLGNSGRSDISENHDEALAEAFRDGPAH